MPEPIYEDTIKIIWENNPDTPLTSSTLSKTMDYVSSYRDYKYAANIHGEGTIFIKDPTPIMADRIIMKGETLFSIINLETRIPINKQYKIFDTGLEDLYIRVEDQDDNSSNPQPNATKWDINKEWFIFLCDAENELSGQILVSLSKISPVQTQVLGSPSYLYNSNNTRLIGGFKTDGFGLIIEESVWDIAGKYKRVKAQEYMILDLEDTAEDIHNRGTYRKLRVSDLDSSSGSNNVFDGSVIINESLSVGNDTSIGGNLNVIDSIIRNGSDGLDIITGDIYTRDNYNNKFTIGKDLDGITEGIIISPQQSRPLHTPLFTVQYGGLDALKITNREITTIHNTFNLNGIKIEKGLSNPTGTAAIGIDGYLYATRVYNAVWNDLAEYFLSESPKLERKIYVIGDNGKVKLSSKYGDTSVVGVCSDSYAFIMKEEYAKEGGVPIALAGTVRVQVSQKLKRGDLITSGKFGIGRKANWLIRVFKNQAIIGKVMEDMKKGDKSVLMLVR